MSDKIVLNLEQFKTYALRSQKECADIKRRQMQIAEAFKRLGENWADSFYGAIGKLLSEVAKKLQLTYNGLRNSIYAMVDYHNTMCEYNDCTHTLHIDCKIEEYSIKIRYGEMTQQIKTDPEMLKRFAQNLDEYCQETERSFREIKRRHDDMRYYWQSPQYNQFKAVIDGVENDLHRQIGQLQTGSNLIKRKYRILTENARKNINKKD